MAGDLRLGTRIGDVAGKHGVVAEQRLGRDARDVMRNRHAVDVGRSVEVAGHRAGHMRAVILDRFGTQVALRELLHCHGLDELLRAGV